MGKNSHNKRKIVNDPVYGFITIPYDIVFDIIEHPYFQRLRRIKQLGLTHLVYPGALHTRFHHAIGAMHLTLKAIEVIRSKGHEVTEEENKATALAILLHDMGHGPFSHALENIIVSQVDHEALSLLFMKKLNREFQGELDLAIKIFSGNYDKPFLHQLVSSQLDMDRMDYLKRDSFFTGVSEGVISAERILSMLNVCNGNLCVDAKGIYSIEKFIIARRLMYWQVYLHKTVIAAENLVINILKRAKEVIGEEQANLTPALNYFLSRQLNQQDFENEPEHLHQFAQLDDFDLTAAIKVWQNHPDRVLSSLCRSLINRKLYRIDLRNEPIPPAEVEKKKHALSKVTSLSENEISYLIFADEISNHAYYPKRDKINLLFRDGSIKDIAQASDQLNIQVLGESVNKYFLCEPKEGMVDILNN